MIRATRSQVIISVGRAFDCYPYDLHSLCQCAHTVYCTTHTAAIRCLYTLGPTNKLVWTSRVGSEIGPPSPRSHPRSTARAPHCGRGSHCASSTRATTRARQQHIVFACFSAVQYERQHQWRTRTSCVERPTTSTEIPNRPRKTCTPN